MQRPVGRARQQPWCLALCLFIGAITVEAAAAAAAATASNSTTDAMAGGPQFPLPDKEAYRVTDLPGVPSEEWGLAPQYAGYLPVAEQEVAVEGASSSSNGKLGYAG